MHACINDVATTILPDSEVNMFADDIALYRIIRSVSDYTNLQNDINSISSCIKHKHLQFNASKCRLMFITKKKTNSLPPPPLILDGTVLSQVSSYKYLGVTFTSNLSWTPHITNCCNKTRRLIELLYRRFYQYSNSSSTLR